MASDEAPQPGAAAKDAETPGPAIVTGPHAWINWYCERVGMPRRKEQHPDAVVLRPIWEEFALYTDCDLHGHMDSGPYEVFTIDHGTARVGEARKRLLLRMWDHMPDEPQSRDVDPPATLDVYFGGDLDDELAALLSLALGRRLRSGGSVRRGYPLEQINQPLGYPSEADHAAPVLQPPRGEPMIPTIGRRAWLGDPVSLFETYPVLPASDAVALLRAARQYADALWIADGDPRLAWLKLVSALEAASTAYDEGLHETPVEQLKRHRPRLYKKLKGSPTATITAVAKEVAHTFNAERKLRAFVEHFDPGPPAERPNAQDWRFDWATLDAALGVLYEHRSNDLHAGIAFPAPLCLPPFRPDDGPAAEQFTGSFGGQGARWTRDRLPMCLHVFAHVVRGALCNWWMALAAAHEEPAGAPILRSQAAPAVLDAATAEDVVGDAQQD